MPETIRPHLFIPGEIPPPPSIRTYNPGGGGTFRRESYREHAAKIFQDASTLDAQLVGSGIVNSTDKIFFRLELPPDKSMSSGEGAKVQENVFSELVGSPDKSVGHLSTTKASFELLLTQLRTYQDSARNTGKANFAQIEKIGLIPLEEKLTDRFNRTANSEEFDGEALVSLFPNLSQRERDSYKKLLQDILSQGNGVIVSEYLSESVLHLKIKAPRETIKRVAESVLAVQSVDAVDHIAVPSAAQGLPIEDEIIVIPNASDAKVCIFDTGVVSDSRFLQSSLIDQEFPLGPPFDVGHGTFVASRVAFGDTLLDQISTGTVQPDVKVLSVCIFPHDGIGNRKPPSTEQLMKVIRSTVERWHHHIRVYNLSVNLQSLVASVNSAISDDSVNPLAAELDLLAKKFDVLFVVSAGNFPSPGNPNPSNPYPQYFDDKSARICPPAEANLALTVGSISVKENAGSIAKNGQPSPFTRRGPGFSGYRKPDLVSHGGNYTQNWRSMNDLSAVGIGKDGDCIAYGNGTSYSTPLVSRLAAHLFEKVPDATSPLVRAMLIHFSNLPSCEGFDPEKFVHLTGNGLPDVNQLMFSTPWHQSYLFQGSVGYREILKIPFYVPSGLAARSGRKALGVRATIAFNSDTDRTLKKGYCKTHLRAKIWKRNRQGVLVGVDTGDGPLNLNNMYSTVIRRDHSFASVSGGDWEISLEQITRWQLANSQTKFGLIISLIDPRSDPNIDIHTLIHSEVPNRYTNSLSIEARLRV